MSWRSAAARRARTRTRYVVLLTQYNVDSGVGVPLIDRYTRAVLEFMEHVDRTSNKTLQDLFDSVDPAAIHSDPDVRKDLFARAMDQVRVTDFFGSVAQVELT